MLMRPLTLNALFRHFARRECCYPSRPRELSKSFLLNNKVENELD